MKSFIKPAILSIAVHGILLLLLLFISYHMVEKVKPNDEFASIFFDSPPISEVQDHISSTPVSYPSLSVSEPAKLPNPQSASEVDLPHVDAEPESTPSPINQNINRIEFFTESLILPPVPNNQLSNGSTPTSDTCLSKFLNRKNEFLFLGRPGPLDQVRNEIEKRNLSGSQSLPVTDIAHSAGRSLTDFLSAKNDDKPIRLDFIPTKAEIHILSYLWETTTAADIDIYTAMDSSFHVSAEDLNRILEVLTEKRLLRRKLISPRNELTLPFGGAVEMSAQNRRNRMYEYTCHVTMEQVLCYLNAVLFELEHGKAEKGGSKHQPEQIALLKERILQAGR